MEVSQKGNSDKLILLTALLLSGIGIIMVYSASAIISLEEYSSHYFFLKKQLLAFAIGLVLMIFAMYFDYNKYRRFSVLFLGVSLALLILVFIPPLGISKNGAMRWIRISSLQFQPSELMKFSLILYVAGYISKKREKINDFMKGILPLSIVVGIFILMLMKQPDFGTVMTIITVIVILLFIGGMSYKYLIGAFAVVVPAAIIAIVSEPYRLKRITTFLNPWENPLSSGFQIIQSMYAFGRGGIFGLGFGEGRGKLFYLPAPYNDFILSVIGEEIGLVGVLTVVTLFFIFIYRGFKVAMNTNDMFGLLLCVGIVSVIGIQGLINIAVSLGMLPTKGIPLPFISFGGSSMITTMFLTGVILNISEHAGK